MSDWTEQEREAAAMALHDAYCPDVECSATADELLHSAERRDADGVLDALAPFVAERERQAAAKAQAQHRHEWAEYIDAWGSAKGVAEPTPQRIVEVLRSIRPTPRPVPLARSVWRESTTDPMTDNPDPDQDVRDAITSWIKHHDEEDVIVLNYAVVAEVIGPKEGEPWLKIASNRTLSSWARLGMAHALVQTSEADLQAGWQEDEED